MVCIGLVAILYGHSLWLVFLFFCLIAAFFLFLPKWIDLQPIDFTVADGPLTPDEMQLKLDYAEWERRSEEENIGFSPLYYFSIVLLLLIFILAISWLVKS
jgi:hypothetical protein